MHLCISLCLLVKSFDIFHIIPIMTTTIYLYMSKNYCQGGSQNTRKQRQIIIYFILLFLLHNIQMENNRMYDEYRTHTKHMQCKTIQSSIHYIFFLVDLPKNILYLFALRSLFSSFFSFLRVKKSRRHIVLERRTIIVERRENIRIRRYFSYCFFVFEKTKQKDIEE